MQLIALDLEKNRVVTVDEALRSNSYLCLECQKFVRKRGGHHRKLHFFHLKGEVKCSQNQKSLIHLNLQHHLISSFPKNEGKMEVHFKTIGRIADVVWERHKLIFEIQVSSISSEEVLARINDYALLGFRVIWILHDTTFNRIRLTQCEELLASYPHYYTNFTSEGKGMIYDQFTIDQKSLRLAKTSPQPIAIHAPCFAPLSPKKKQYSRHLYRFVTKRWRLWPLSFDGDLLSSPPSLKQMKAFERRYFLKNPWLKQFIHRYLINPYLNCFNLALENMFH